LQFSTYVRHLKQSYDLDVGKHVVGEDQARSGAHPPAGAR
jgi:hypothetical protein